MFSFLIWNYFIIQVTKSHGRTLNVDLINLSLLYISIRLYLITMNVYNIGKLKVIK